MITELKNTADLQKLPAYLLAAFNLDERFAHRKGEKVACIQRMDIRAITERSISYSLGESILRGRKALRPKGKAMLKTDESHKTQEGKD